MEELCKKISRVILIATGEKELLPTSPTPLLSVGDKPILFHIIETLKRKGIGTFEVILHEKPEQIEEALGSGERWGVSIHYHLVTNPESPFKTIIPVAKNWKDSLLLIGKGDVLPLSNICHAPSPAAFYTTSKEWSGWAVIPRKVLSEYLINSHPSALIQDISPLQKETISVMTSYSYRSLLDANQRLITENTSLLLPTTSREVEPKMWISRAVTIEPDATIIPPVFIGENSTIRSGATIGPNTIIENHCVIDNGTKVEHSLVTQHSYIGEDLKIENSIICQNLLVNLTLNTSITINEEFLLGTTQGPKANRWLQSITERGIATLAFVCLLPIYLFLRARMPLNVEQKLSLPSEKEESRWKTFSCYSFPTKSPFRKLPYLIHIIKGELSFVGAPLRSKEEVYELPKDWQTLYLQEKPGWITLNDVEKEGSHPTSSYISETYYHLQRSTKMDLGILLRFLWKTVRGKRK